MFDNNLIKLHKLAINDYPLYHQWRNDTDVMESTSPQLDQYTLAETEEFITFLTSHVNLDYKNRSAECIINIGVKNVWGVKVLIKVPLLCYSTMPSTKEPFIFIKKLSL